MAKARKVTVSVNDLREMMRGAEVVVYQTKFKNKNDPTYIRALMDRALADLNPTDLRRTLIASAGGRLD